MKLFYKLLNRLNLLKYINVTSSVSVNNKSFKIPIINSLGIKNLNHKPSWITHLLSNFELRMQPLVIFDIGVNIGQTLLSVKSLNLNCEYIGFEPNPNCVYYLNKLIKKNKFNNTTILPIAISDEIEVIDLYFNNDTDATATTLESFRPNHYEEGFKEKIISFDLDTLTNLSLKINQVDVLKIDIEGAELYALKGARKLIELHKPIIICEVLDTHSIETLESHKERLQTIERIIKELDYKMYQIHRNYNDTKVIKCKLVNNFDIKIWGLESLKLNDYLFVPRENFEQLKALFNLLD